MAEESREAQHGVSGHNHKHAEGHAGGPAHEGEGEFDPMHHIRDVVLFGVNARGGVRYKPYRHGKAVAGYAPATLGPIKLEFTKHMLTLSAVAALLFIVITLVARKVTAAVRRDEAPKGPLANAVEALVFFVRDDLVVPIGGRHLAPYTPLFITYFFFILTANLVGMIPEAGGATGNIAITAALGGSVLLILTGLGMIHQGPLNYFRNMLPAGTHWAIGLIMWPVEFFGPIIKCFVLCMRLFANMIAGHLVITNVLFLGAFGKGALMPWGLALLGLFIGVPLAIGISLLEILVCFIQTYVFTMLAVIFVGAAVHPEH